jgi:hypothetical protein
MISTTVGLRATEITEEEISKSVPSLVIRGSVVPKGRNASKPTQKMGWIARKNFLDRLGSL